MVHIAVLKELLKQDLVEFLLKNDKGSFDVLSSCFLPFKLHISWTCNQQLHPEPSQSVPALGRCRQHEARAIVWSKQAVDGRFDGLETNKTMGLAESAESGKVVLSATYERFV
jgi:hypothetical protein